MIKYFRRTQNGTLWVRRPKTPLEEDRNAKKSDSITPVNKNSGMLYSITVIEAHSVEIRQTSNKESTHLSQASLLKESRILNLATMSPDRNKNNPTFMSKSMNFYL